MAAKKPIANYDGRQKEMQTGDTVPLTNGGTGQTTAGDALNALLPTQTGNSGKVLQTDGTNTSWQTAGGGGAGDMNANFASGTGGTSILSSETSIGTVTITPQSSTSSILITARMTATKDSGTTRRTVTARVKRGSTQIGQDSIIYAQNVASTLFGPAVIMAIDSTHGVTTEITYTLYATETNSLSTSDDWEITVVELMGAQGEPGVDGTNGTNGATADMTRASTSSVAVGTGSKTFAYSSSTNLGWVVGTRLRVSNTSSIWMEGAITAVSSTSVTISCDLLSGSGTYTSWNLSIAGEKGTATPRVQAVTSSATVTPNADADDLVIITAQAAGLTLAAPTGTPVNGQVLMIRIKDNGTVRAITWNAAYRAIGAALTTATTISKTLYACCIWNSTDSKWDVLPANIEQ